MFFKKTRASRLCPCRACRRRRAREVVEQATAAPGEKRKLPRGR